ncbi:hypothetical protein E2C01_018242 [Portunus trituberculatus]|uniref:Uncharacterized protein n=1 Tax=Portunus trituberculatus TaxID=210409 RepID=A0A5B7DU07_PORTR|nr:hypothetical protein [Portunus trituberculatus]
MRLPGGRNTGRSQSQVGIDTNFPGNVVAGGPEVLSTTLHYVTTFNGSQFMAGRRWTKESTAYQDAETLATIREKEGRKRAREERERRRKEVCVGEKE